MTPDEFYYIKSHECFSVEDKQVTLYLTEYAVEQLGDITYVELPQVNETFEREEAFGEVESVKTVSELYMPVSGTVVAVNGALAEQPELINVNCYTDGWLIRVDMSDPGELEKCMRAQEYAEYIEQLG